MYQQNIHIHLSRHYLSQITFHSLVLTTPHITPPCVQQQMSALEPLYFLSIIGPGQDLATGFLQLFLKPGFHQQPRIRIPSQQLELLDHISQGFEMKYLPRFGEGGVNSICIIFI